MLGKLIKNEFVNRWKSILVIYGIISILGLLYALVTYIRDDTNVDNKYFEIIWTTIILTFALALYTSMVAIVLQSFGDYNKRFFKDQGYLTHTLPVKTIHLLIARMICDLCVCVSMGIFYPFIICVAERDFSFFKDVAKYISFFIQNENVLELLSELTTFVVILVLCILVGIWTYYAAYAIGHSFSTGKRAKSILAYIIIYVIGIFTFMFVEIEIFATVDLNIRSDIYILFLALCVCALVAITNYTCKNKLNLE